MNREARERDPADRGDTISRNAVFAFATQMATAAFTAMLTVFLTRMLGPTEYGILSLALAVTGLVLRPAAGGTSQAAARFVAERHGDTENIARVLGMALRWRLLTAAAVAAALFALAEPIAGLYDAPAMAWPLRGVAIAFFGQSVFLLSNTVFVAMRRASGAFAVVVSESALEFSASVALVLLGGGVTGAAFGRAVGYLFGALLGIILLSRFLGRSPLFAGRSPVARREFAGYAGVMFVVSTASAIFNRVDVLLIGAYLNTAAVGIYSAPLRLIAFLGYPGYAAAQGVAPRLAGRPDARSDVVVLVRGLRYVVVIQAGIVAFLLAWAEPLVRLTIGSEFLESAEVLRALTPFVFLTGIGPLLVSPLNYAGEGRRRIPISIATLVLAAGLCVTLIPQLGILGGAVATDVAYALYVGGHLWLCHRLLDLPMRPLAITAGRSFAAAAAMGAVLALIGTGSISPLAWVAGLVAGGAVFFGALHLLGELPIGELRRLATVSARALRRR